MFVFQDVQKSSCSNDASHSEGSTVSASATRTPTRSENENESEREDAARENGNGNGVRNESPTGHGPGTGNGSVVGNESRQGLNLKMSAKELRAQLAARKKYDPKKESIGFKDKFDIVQKL